MSDILAKMIERGLVAQVSDDSLGRQMQQERFTFYTGFDPTAASLHLGHLVPLICARHLQQAGHRFIALVGGATGMVGDPSGRSAERNLLTHEQVRANTACLKAQIARFVSFEGPNAALLLDNYDWIGPMSFIDWLRDVGKHFPINQMLAKDSVKLRLEGEGGLSFTEFSYMTMQAFDFLHLHEAHGCRLQCGGSDQWGNITAGLELIRRKVGGSAFGLTYPLITTNSGQKFGKSAGNSVWLEAGLTSPYDFYQYLIRTEDADIERYMRIFTFLELPDIATLMAQHNAAPERRLAQKRLADELTALVHGAEGLGKAVKATEVLFGGGLEGLTEQDLKKIFADVPSRNLPESSLQEGWGIVDLLVAAGVCSSKGEARRAIQGGGLYLNNRRIDSAEARVGAESLAAGHLLVLRSGRKNYTLVEFS